MTANRELLSNYLRETCRGVVAQPTHMAKF